MRIGITAPPKFIAMPEAINLWVLNKPKKDFTSAYTDFFLAKGILIADPNNIKRKSKIVNSEEKPSFSNPMVIIWK